MPQSKDLARILLATATTVLTNLVLTPDFLLGMAKVHRELDHKDVSEKFELAAALILRGCNRSSLIHVQAGIDVARSAFDLATRYPLPQVAA